MLLSVNIKKAYS